MKLYEINEQLENLLMIGDEYVDTTTGEVLTKEIVDELNMAKEEKIEGCILFVKNMNAEAAAIKEEIDKLTARMKTCKNKAEWCKEYVQNFLDGEKFKTAKVQVSYGKSVAVEIDIDAEDLPREFVTVEYKPDKKAIKDALQSGVTVEGARIVEKRTMRIK